MTEMYWFSGTIYIVGEIKIPVFISKTLLIYSNPPRQADSQVFLVSNLIDFMLVDTCLRIIIHVVISNPNEETVG